MPIPPPKNSKQLLKLLVILQKTNNPAVREAFEIGLFELYNKRLLAYTRNFFLKEQAADIVQDFYLKKILGKTLATYPTQTIQDFESYLFASMYYFCLEVIRIELGKNEKKEEHALLEEKKNKNRVNTFEIEQIPDSIRLRKLLPILKTKHMLAIILRMEKLSRAQVARVLNTNEHNITLWVTRGRDKIIRYMQDNNEERIDIKDKKEWLRLIQTIPDDKLKAFLGMIMFTNKHYMEIIEELDFETRPIRRIVSTTLVYIRRYYKSAA